MKISTAKVISKVTKAAAKATKAAKATVATKTDKVAESPLKVRKAYNCKNLVELGKLGLGSNLAVCGREILDEYITELINNREKLTSTKLAPAGDKVLLVESPMYQVRGPRLFAWPIVKAAGDIIELREDYWRTGTPNTVRTSVALLKKHVAAVKEKGHPTVVRIVSKAQAMAEMAKAKVFAGSKQLFEAAK